MSGEPGEDKGFEVSVLIVTETLLSTNVVGMLEALMLAESKDLSSAESEASESTVSGDESILLIEELNNDGTPVVGDTIKLDRLPTLIEVNDP